MPNKDGTGPLGQGAGTGREMGSCVNKEQIDNLDTDNISLEKVVDKRTFGLRNGQGRCQLQGRNGKLRGNGQGRRCCGNKF